MCRTLFSHTNIIVLVVVVVLMLLLYMFCIYNWGLQKYPEEDEAEAAGALPHTFVERLF